MDAGRGGSGGTSSSPGGSGGGSGGSGGSGGTTGGGGGGGGAGTGGAGASDGGSGSGGAAGEGTGGSAGTSADAGVPEAAVQPGPDAPAAMPGSCSITPGANAASLKLAFRQIATPGLAGGGSGKSPAGLTELRFLPHAADELLISQKGGGLTHYKLVGDMAMPIRTYRIPGVDAQQDCGFISFALDPNFKDNKFIYAGYCTGANTSKLTRFTLGATLASPVDILNFNGGANTAWHSVGSIGFDKTGALWMLHGEFTNGANAQNLNSQLGKLLRLIPKPDGTYSPAPGNAFPPGTAGRNPLIYAYGFRSPWRGYLDSRGRYLVGDVGPTTAEELNLVSKAGENFGWSTRTGPCTGCGQTNPLVTYRVGNDPYRGQGDEDLEGREGRAIWVGVQYQNCGNDRYDGAMTGVYLFGDIYTGWVRGAIIDDEGKKTIDKHLADVPGFTAFAQAADGYIYALKFGAYGTGGLAEQPAGLFRVVKAP